jgi:DNA (cytosine-5)-methyltransferase 1
LLQLGGLLMVRPRLLDLFCGAGGAAMGYHRAGFDVVGVDIKPQPNYPFDFWHCDVLEFMERAKPDKVGFDAVHASPPCQAYVRSGMVAKDGRHPDLLPITRDLLQETGLPWVIENVPGAPMRVDLMLCGSMFGLEVRRHRWFETSPQLFAMVPPCDHSRPITGVYGHPHGKGGAWRNGRRPMLPSDLPTWSRAMGIDWMAASEIALAIPPAYTQFIGELMLDAVPA